MNKQTNDSPSGNKTGFLKKARAAICHHCPFCKHARNKPMSLLGRALHHKLHSDNCPMWKAEQEIYKGND